MPLAQKLPASIHLPRCGSRTRPRLGARFEGGRGRRFRGNSSNCAQAHTISVLDYKRVTSEQVAILSALAVARDRDGGAKSLGERYNETDPQRNLIANTVLRAREALGKPDGTSG